MEWLKGQADVDGPEEVKDMVSETEMRKFKGVYLV